MHQIYCSQSAYNFAPDGPNCRSSDPDAHPAGFTDDPNAPPNGSTVGATDPIVTPVGPTPGPNVPIAPPVG